MATDKTEQNPVEMIDAYCQGILANVMGGTSTDDFHAIAADLVDTVSAFRIVFDDVAKLQGNSTIRQQRSDSGKTSDDNRTPAEKAADALAKAKARRNK